MLRKRSFPVKIVDHGRLIDAAFATGRGPRSDPGAEVEPLRIAADESLRKYYEFTPLGGPL
jgi:hypothetical protein